MQSPEMTTATNHLPDDPDLKHILDLIRHSFAYMEHRIDPPSSMLKLTLEDIAQQCSAGEVWSLKSDEKIVACVFLTPKADEILYIGKLAVDESVRGRGFARYLVEIAEKRACELGLGILELQSRIELVENHQTFASLGFVKTGEDAHEGYNRPTSIRMQKRLV